MELHCLWVPVDQSSATEKMRCTIENHAGTPVTVANIEPSTKVNGSTDLDFGCQQHIYSHRPNWCGMGTEHFPLPSGIRNKSRTGNQSIGAVVPILPAAFGGQQHI